MSGIEWASSAAAPGTLIIGALLAVAGVLFVIVGIAMRGTAVAWGLWGVGAVALIVGLVIAPSGLNQTPDMKNADSLRDGYEISQTDARALVEAGPDSEVPVVIDGDKVRASVQLSSDGERAILVVNGKRVALAR